MRAIRDELALLRAEDSLHPGRVLLETGSRALWDGRAFDWKCAGYRLAVDGAVMRGGKGRR